MEPSIGEVEIVVDHLNAPSVVTRITEVEVVPFNPVSARFAAREGEGDGSLDCWRKAHRAFFSRECQRIGRVPSETMPVVCCSFEVLHVVPAFLSSRDVVQEQPHEPITCLNEDAKMLKTYRGSCHCGAVKFEADLDLTQGTYRCNCSICRRTRFWPAVARADGFRMLAGETELTQYLFNTKKNHHYFCKHCGVRAFGVGNETPIGKMYGVNLGCLEGVSEEELARAPITYVDGRNDKWQSTPEFFSHL